MAKRIPVAREDAGEVDGTSKRLNQILGVLQKKYSNEVVQIPDQGAGSNVSWTPTDSPNINSLLGFGIPRGRMIEIYGPESSGKSSCAFFLGGQVQRSGGLVGYIDGENAVDFEYAATFGLDVGKTLYCQPDNGEQALDIMIDMIEQGVDLIVLDSTDTVVPQAEIEGEMGDSTMAVRARLFSKFCRKATAINKNTTVVLISQVRAAIGSMSKDIASSASNAIKFYCSIRIKCTFREFIMHRDGEEVLGMFSRLKTVKNKVAAPGRVRVMKVLFGKGYQVEEEWIEYATYYDVIQKKGAGWFSLTVPGAEKPESVQGMANLVARLQSDPDLKTDIIKRTKAMMSRSGPSPVDIDKAVADPAESVAASSTLAIVPDEIDDEEIDESTPEDDPLAKED